MMDLNNLTDEDLSDYHRASEAQSRMGNQKPMNAFPAEFKARIANFYTYLREQLGVYPDKIDSKGKMQYLERVTNEEAWRRRLKNEKMFPPAPKNDEDLPF